MRLISGCQTALAPLPLRAKFCNLTRRHMQVDVHLGIEAAGQWRCGQLLLRDNLRLNRVGFSAGLYVVAGEISPRVLRYSVAQSCGHQLSCLSLFRSLCNLE